MALAIASRNFPDLRNLNTPFFIISIPGSLCLVDLCLKFLPKEQDVVIVANGLEKTELNWIKENLETDEIIKIKWTVDHGAALDLLFDCYDKNFGIIDYDCFVLDASYLDEMKKIDINSMMNALFIYENRKLNLDIPKTYILFFNNEIIRKIKQKFKVNSRIIHYRKLTNQVKKKLLTLGIDQYNHIDHKNYFDTLRVIYLLGLTEGYRCNYLLKYPAVSSVSQKVFHVGAGNNTEKINNAWNTRGTYLWRRALESCQHKELQDYYYIKYGMMKSWEIFEKVPKICEEIGNGFFEFVNQIVGK